MLSLQTRAQAELERRRRVEVGWQCDAHLCPTEWIQRHFYVPNVLHPITGRALGEGPIILADYQGRMIREALSRLPNGDFRYSTVLWSDIKKSAKTTLAAAVGLWFASTQTNMGHVYCLANDGKGSKDREYTSIVNAITINKKHSGIFQGVKPRDTWLDLPNGTRIEAIGVDPEGEAGAEPDMTIWGEVWGFRQTHKLRLWTEMTIPPTKFGRSIRWVESYAGYVGESTLLEELYKTGAGMPLLEDGAGIPHPGITDLPVWINEKARMLTMWKQRPMLAWQTPEYYTQEAQQLTDSEFRRIHKNEWVSPINQFVPLSAWDNCKRSDLPPWNMKECVVVAVDAAVSGDCCAIVVGGKWDGNKVRVLESLVWAPPPGGTIDYSKTLEPAIRRIAGTWNVVRVSYDPFQLHKLATDMQRELGIHFKEFKQGQDRLIADKQLYDLIMSGQIYHTGDMDMRDHVAAAAAKSEGEKYLRIVKHSGGGKPIDLVVATSMMAASVLYLNL